MNEQYACWRARRDRTWLGGGLCPPLICPNDSNPNKTLSCNVTSLLSQTLLCVYSFVYSIPRGSTMSFWAPGLNLSPVCFGAWIWFCLWISGHDFVFVCVFQLGYGFVFVCGFQWLCFCLWVWARLWLCFCLWVSMALFLSVGLS